MLYLLPGKFLPSHFLSEDFGPPDLKVPHPWSPSTLNFSLGGGLLDLSSPVSGLSSPKALGSDYWDHAIVYHVVRRPHSLPPAGGAPGGRPVPLPEPSTGLGTQRSE